MKPITRDFEQALKNIKRIDAIISYADRENTNYIVTQNSELLLTEASDYLVTESADVVIDNNGIQNCNIYWNTNILKSCCKMLDLETSNAIPKGTEVFVKVGLLVNDEYEYVDYGSFFIIQDSEKKLDTNTYLTTGYDKMVKFSINVSENPLTFEEGTTYTLKQYLEMICNKCGVPYSLSGLSTNINANISLINSNLYENNKTTIYRDIVDDIAKCLGTNFIINENGKFTNKDFNITNVMTIDDDNLKNTNVNVGEKKESIDGIQIYDGSTMINYVGESNSIFIIKNNNIMNAYNSQLLNYVLTKIEGISYYEYEIDTYGILALEPFDFYKLDNTSNNISYQLLSLHNNISLGDEGLEEQISYDFKNEDDVYEYNTPSSEDKLNDASIEINKALGEIVLKVNSNGKLAKVKLGSDADDGTTFDVEADNINFNGKDFNVTTENMKISIGTGSNKVELINSLGIMSTFIVQGNVVSSSFTGGTCMLPLGYSQSENGYAKDRLEFDFVIPKGFVVDKAYVTLNHMPSTITYDYNSSRQGYCRNMRLYKATSYNNGRLLIDLLSYSPIGESGVSYQSISNIFNGSDFSGNNNGFSSATSSDISNYIVTSDNNYSYNKFKIETTDGQPSSYEDMVSRNGCLQGTITIIGHMKF